MNWTDPEYPTAPWDTPDLPPRTMAERCARHKHCAYRDDDPARCPLCHASPEKCNGTHGVTTEYRHGGIAGRTNGTLKAGQYNDPREEANRRLSMPQRPTTCSYSGSREAIPA